MTAIASDTLGIRPMTEDDVDWVVAQERLLHDFPWTRGNFIDSLAAGYAARLLLIDGKPAGYAIMLSVIDEVHLLNISVIQDRQGQGVGSGFLLRLMNEARHLGARQCFLEVRPSNEAALKVYKRHGFASIGRRKGYYPSQNGAREDAIVMRLDL